MWPILMITLAGCEQKNPVEDCEHFPRTDCCKLDSQCFDFYGAEFAFCSDANVAEGGICVQCEIEDDCKAGWLCLDNQCVDPDACYEGEPWPNKTSCN